MKAVLCTVRRDLSVFSAKMRTNDGRRRKTRHSTKGKKRGSYKKNLGNDLKRALEIVKAGASYREAETITKVPKTTISRAWKEFQEQENGNRKDIKNFVQQRPAAHSHPVILTEEEEEVVEKYCLWQFDRGMGLSRKQVKAIIREIRQRAVDKGERRQSINCETGPSKKYMKGFYKRHPKLSDRRAETVDRGRINMANKDTINEYFKTLKTVLIETGVADVDENNEITQQHADRIYLADETGWGAEKKAKKVVGRKGASHAHVRKPSDESHKTLMLAVCGNGDVLKPLIILEKSFPMLQEEEAEFLPEQTLFSKTENGSMEKELFVEWLKYSVVPHKQRVNPNQKSILIVDNHGSRFSAEAIDLCVDNGIEVICYPGHLTHILQGPDVVLNKPLKTNVDAMIQNNMLLTGNSLISRLEFINIVDNAISVICTKELVLKSFSATGVLPFNPEKIDLSQFPSSLANATPISESPVQATCSTCRVANVQLHPLVKQGCIPKKLADVFMYTAPSGKPRSRAKTVEKARIVTSEEVRAEIISSQKRKRAGQKKKSATAPKRKKPSDAVSKKPPKKTRKFKEMVLEESDSDSESEVSSVAPFSDSEESGLEDDAGLEKTAVDETADINFTIAESTHDAVELDIREVPLGRWVKICYDGAWFLGITTEKKECSKTGAVDVKVRCFEVPIVNMNEPMELEEVGRSIWYKKVYDTKIVPSLVVIKRKHLYCI